MEKYFGIYPAIVCSVKDPEKRGRIKVTCPDVFGDVETSSAWCDPCVPCGVEDGGDICVPDIDEGVWIMFNGGDIDLPVYLGGWWSAGRTPFLDDYPSKPNEVRIINFKDVTATMTESKCDLDIGDKAGEYNISVGTDNGSFHIVVGEKSGEFSISVGKDVEITTDGTNVNVKCTKLTIDGNVEIANDCKIGGKSYLSHKHRCGSDDTSTPL